MKNLFLLLSIIITGCVSKINTMTLDEYLEMHNNAVDYTEKENAGPVADRDSAEILLKDNSGNPVNGIYRVDQDTTFGDIMEFKDGKIKKISPIMLPTITIEPLIIDAMTYKKNDIPDLSFQKIFFNIVMDIKTIDKNKEPLNGTVFVENKTCKYTYIGPVYEGRKDGDSHEFCDGKIAAIRPFSDGQLHGILRTYYDNGRLKTRERYRRGRKSGLSIYYDSKGKSKTEWF